MNKLGIRVVLLTSVLLAACDKESSVPVDPATERPAALKEAAALSVADRYIVVFKKGTAMLGAAGRTVPDVAAAIKAEYGGQVFRHYQYALEGIAIQMSARAVEALRKDRRVAYIEPDAIATAIGTQENATWGLDRVDQRLLPLNQTYVYPDSA